MHALTLNFNKIVKKYAPTQEANMSPANITNNAVLTSAARAEVKPDGGEHWGIPGTNAASNFAKAPPLRSCNKLGIPRKYYFN